MHTHTHSSNRLLHKSVSKIFLIMIRKEEKCVHGFFWSWLYAFQWEKTIENHKYVGTGAGKIENLVRFWPSFSQYSESTKKVQNIDWKYWNILQRYWKYWKTVLKRLMHFALHSLKVLELNCFTLKYIDLKNMFKWSFNGICCYGSDKIKI